MNCWNGNPYVSHVDNVVPGKPAGEPHQPNAIHDYSATVAAGRADEPHQQWTSSEAMDRQRRQPALRGDQQAHYKRVGQALVRILRYENEDRDQWLTIDELLQRLRRGHSRTDVEDVLAADRRRFMCRRREVDASGWAEYEYSARPRKQR